MAASKYLTVLTMCATFSLLARAHKLSVISKVTPNCSKGRGHCYSDLHIIVNIFNTVQMQEKTISINETSDKNGLIAEFSPPVIIKLSSRVGTIRHELVKLGQVNTGPTLHSTPTANCSVDAYNDSCYCCYHGCAPGSECDDTDLVCLQHSDVWYDLYAPGKTVVDQNLTVDVSWKARNLSSQYFFDGLHRETASGDVIARYIVHSSDPAVQLSMGSRLLLPENTKKSADLKQLEQEALLLDESEIDSTGRTCAKIGVSKRTILKQRDRCERKPHCLTNQILDVKPSSQLTTSLPQTKLRETANKLELIRLGFAASSFQLSLPAPEVIFIYKQARVQISDIHSYNTKSQYFKLQVHLFVPTNTTQEVKVKVDGCDSMATKPVQSVRGTLKPFDSTEFIFTIKYSEPAQTNIHCYIIVRDVDGLLIARRRFSLSFEHEGLCVGPCKCVWINKLTSSKECQAMDDLMLRSAGFTQSSKIFQWNQNGGQSAGNLSLTSAIILLISVLFLIGWLKAVCGLSRRCVRIGNCGLCLLQKRGTQPQEVEKELFDDVVARQPPLSDVLKQLVINALFMFYLLLIPLHYVCLKWRGDNSTNALIMTSTASLGPQARRRLIKIAQNQSGNNKQGVPSTRDNYIEDQLVFGAPSTTNIQVLQKKTCSFDNHLQGVVPPAVIQVKSTTAMYDSHRRVVGGGTNSDFCGKTTDVESGEKMRQLQVWNEVRRIGEKKKIISTSWSDAQQTRHKTVSSQPMECNSFDVDENLLHCTVAESLTDEVTKSQIEMLLDVETPLYFNSCVPLRGLTNPGSTFSLCGRLQQIRKGLYQFDLALHKVQLYEYKRNRLIMLDEHKQLKVEDFVIKLDCNDVVKYITMEPVFACLNQRIH